MFPLLPASSRIPRSSCFRFENAWLKHPSFTTVILDALAQPVSGAGAKAFIHRLKNCRRECKAWSRRLRPIDQREQDTRVLINALDLLEEARPLTHGERTLREDASRSLQAISAEKLAFWRQRFKIRLAMEWDENSRFFHAAASGRRRKNLIHSLDHDGQSYTAHDAKDAILHDFYAELLGTTKEVSWRFNLHDLYPALAVSSLNLSRPFTTEEISEALFAMDKNASPGPDGFGPSFYAHFWQTIRADLHHLFDCFHASTLELDGLNRAHLILLPKKQGARTADAYRPISLQNCPMKLFTKVMSNRLRAAIPMIIDADQTGFVHGRSIAENFVYAADILSCCHKRKIPTAVLKLDFKKAFDSVEWSSLDAILHARGFDNRWCTWVRQILSSGKTAVMLNGVPGRWINCRRGLRQGDPISPYLFIIVADVLQRLIRRASENGELCHPVDPTIACPVLQYADDTLVITRGDIQSMTTLKSILDDFSAATGLSINFHKSTFVPMHVAPAEATSMATTLGCAISTFPQVYLGLPLSPHKLRVSDYAPLIQSFDRYLSGWKARLLSTGGRLILINAVLGGLTTYYMSSLLLPKTVCEILDARRRAFLWTGDDKCNGSQCLIKWERLCTSKECGGLGIKNLADQNHCLLLKFIHKLHDASPLPWKEWFNGHLSDANSFLGRIVDTELPRYRSLTAVQIGNGRHTSFWHDRWLLSTTLAETFPALFSHSTCPEITVQAAMATHLSGQLRPRLTNAASTEKDTLLQCLQMAPLNDDPDRRHMTAWPNAQFSSRSAYIMTHINDTTNPDVARIWKTKLPLKVKFFGWLLYFDRLNTRANLYHKNIRTLEESHCEHCPGTLETDDHIFVLCPRAEHVWARLGLAVRQGEHRSPWLLGCSLQLPSQPQTDVMLLTLWHVWKARNAVVFDHQSLSTTQILHRVVADLEQWSCRFKKTMPQLLVWKTYISSRI
ncbi:unnamed protein product [Urochloa humidicola]